MDPAEWSMNSNSTKTKSHQLSFLTNWVMGPTLLDIGCHQTLGLNFENDFCCSSSLGDAKCYRSILGKTKCYRPNLSDDLW